MVSDTKTSHHQEPTQREIHYTWGKFKAVIGIILTVSALFFYLGLFADNSKAGDSLYGIDLWLEEVKFSTTFRHSAKQDVAIDIATERLTELLELETNDKETKLLALYELDKALVRVINLTNPSDTDVIDSLQEERQKTARLIAIIQGVYAQNEPQNIQNNEHSEVENEQVTAEHDDFIEFGTSVIQSLSQGEEAIEQTNSTQPLPTNTPIPTPVKPATVLPTATPIPTNTPAASIPPGENATEAEFEAVLNYSKGVYTMTHNSTTYTVVNGANYSQYVGEILKVHADLYSNNTIVLTEVERED